MAKKVSRSTDTSVPGNQPEPPKVSTIHIHLNELPGWMANKSSGTGKYALEVLAAMGALQYTHEKVLTSANHARFLIQQIAGSTAMQPDIDDVVKAIRDSTYHYENYCLRAYIFREKALLFLNEGLKIGYKPGDVNLKSIITNQAVREAGLLPCLEKFESGKKSAMGEIIHQRKVLTHRQSFTLTDHLLRPELEYKTEAEFKDWCRKWSRNINDRTQKVDSAEKQVSDIHHLLAERSVRYREGLRPKNRVATRVM